MYRNCQVCGNPIFSAENYGTDTGGQLNRDYCSNCYKEGSFYTGDLRSEADELMPFAGLFAGRNGSGFYNGFN